MSVRDIDALFAGGEKRVSRSAIDRLFPEPMDRAGVVQKGEGTTPLPGQPALWGPRPTPAAQGGVYRRGPGEIAVMPETVVRAQPVQEPVVRQRGITPTEREEYETSFTRLRPPAGGAAGPPEREFVQPRPIAAGYEGVRPPEEMDVFNDIMAEPIRAGERFVSGAVEGVLGGARAMGHGAAQLVRGLGFGMTPMETAQRIVAGRRPEPQPVEIRRGVARGALGAVRTGMGLVPAMAVFSGVLNAVSPYVQAIGERIGGERGASVAQTVVGLLATLKFGPIMTLAVAASQFGPEGVRYILDTADWAKDIPEQDKELIAEAAGDAAFIGVLGSAAAGKRALARRATRGAAEQPWRAMAAEDVLSGREPVTQRPGETTEQALARAAEETRQRYVREAIGPAQEAGQAVPTFLDERLRREREGFTPRRGYEEPAALIGPQPARPRGGIVAPRQAVTAGGEVLDAGGRPLTLAMSLARSGLREQDARALGFVPPNFDWREVERLRGLEPTRVTTGPEPIPRAPAPEVPEDPWERMMRELEERFAATREYEPGPTVIGGEAAPAVRPLEGVEMRPAAGPVLGARGEPTELARRLAASGLRETEAKAMGLVPQDYDWRQVDALRPIGGRLRPVLPGGRLEQELPGARGAVLAGAEPTLAEVRGVIEDAGLVLRGRWPEGAPGDYAGQYMIDEPITETTFSLPPKELTPERLRAERENLYAQQWPPATEAALAEAGVPRPVWEKVRPTTEIPPQAEAPAAPTEAPAAEPAPAPRSRRRQAEPLAAPAGQASTQPKITPAQLKEQKQTVLSEFDKAIDTIDSVVFSEGSKKSIRDAEAQGRDPGAYADEWDPEKIKSALTAAGFKLTEDGRVITEVPDDGTFIIRPDNLVEARRRVSSGFPTTVPSGEEKGRVPAVAKTAGMPPREELSSYKDTYFPVGSTGYVVIGGKVLLRTTKPRGLKPDDVRWDSIPAEKGEENLTRVLGTARDPAQRLGYVVNDQDFGYEGASFSRIPHEQAAAVFKTSKGYYLVPQDQLNLLEAEMKPTSWAVNETHLLMGLDDKGNVLGGVMSLREVNSREGGYFEPPLTREQVNARWPQVGFLEGEPITWAPERPRPERPAPAPPTEGQPAEGDVVILADEFPSDLAGGLKSDVNVFEAMGGRLVAVAQTKSQWLNAETIDAVRETLEASTGLRWTPDSVSSHVFHSDLTPTGVVPDPWGRYRPGAQLPPTEKPPPEGEPPPEGGVEEARVSTARVGAVPRPARDLFTGEPEPAVPAAGNPTEAQPIIDKAMKRISIGAARRERRSLSEWLRDVYRRYIHGEEAIAALDRKIERMFPGKVPPGMQAYRLVQRYRGVAEVAAGPLLYHTTRFNPETGEPEITGSGLRDILRPVSQNIDDFRLLLKARAELERASMGIKGMSAERAQRELGALQLKYGENYQRLEDVAQGFRQWSIRAMMDPLHDVGAISDAAYKNSLARHQHWAPLNRLLETLEAEGALPTARQRFQPRKVPFYRIRGTAKDYDFIDPLESAVTREYAVTNFVNQLRVAKAVLAYRNLSPEIAALFPEVKPPAVPVAQIEVEAMRDAHLRRQLLQYASELGTRVETTLRIRGKGVAGYFRGPDYIRLRHISNEHVLAHEIGHRLDFALGLQDKFLRHETAETRKAINEELRKVADLRGVTKAYGRKGTEKMAEMIAAYVTAPELLRQEAPTTMRVLEGMIGEVPELKPLGNMHNSLALSIERMTETIYRPSKFQPPNTIFDYENGKKRYFEAPEDIRRALLSLDPREAGMVSPLLRYPTRILRAGATLALEFIARNLIRDQWPAYVYSRYGYVPFWDLARGIFHLVKRDEMYQEWLSSGAAHSMFVSMDRRRAQLHLQDVLGRPLYQQVGRLLVNPLEALEILSETMEKGTRLGAYTRIRRGGVLFRRGERGTPTQGMDESRELTIDFSRMGPAGRTMNQIVAFWNANVQSADKLRRTMGPKAFADNPKAAATAVLRATLGITIPSLTLWSLNHKDEEYKEFPQWQKDLFWLVKLPGWAAEVVPRVAGVTVRTSRGSLWMRFPKPFELGILFGTMPEHMLDFAEQRDPNSILTIGNAFMAANWPGIVPTVAQPIIENYFNYGFWRERPIVPRQAEGLEPEYQVTPYTGATARLVGRAIGYSPAKVEHLITGYTAGVGQLALQSADAVLRKVGVARTPPAAILSPADVPLARAFIPREPIGSVSKSVDEFYRLYEDASRARKSLTEAALSEEDMPGFLDRYPEFYLYDALDQVNQSFSQMRAARDQIYESRDMTPEEKRRALNELNRAQTDVARQALEQSKEVLKQLKAEARKK